MDGSVGLPSLQTISMPVLRSTTIGPQASKQQTEAAKAAAQTADKNTVAKPEAKTEDKHKKDELGRIADAVTVANTLADFLDKKISFAYDERINQVIVKIIRESTQEVIRQIPPEELVELMAGFRKDFRGLIFNQTS
jgi:flagellar protein FlaG